MEDLDRACDLVLAEQKPLLLRWLSEKRVGCERLGLPHFVAFSLSHINYKKLLRPELSGCHWVALERLWLGSLVRKRLHHIIFLIRVIFSVALLNRIFEPLCSILLLGLLWSLNLGLLLFVSCFHSRGVACCALEICRI
jgi:hypothetical protein